MAHNQGGLNGIESVSGVTPPTTSAVEKITLQNYDSNPARVNQANNQKSFLGLTSQYTTTKFSSESLDMAFGDGAGNVGTNPFFEPPSTATKVFVA